jgi:hypothetical protein
MNKLGYVFSVINCVFSRIFLVCSKMQFYLMLNQNAKQSFGWHIFMRKDCYLRNIGFTGG